MFSHSNSDPHQSGDDAARHAPSRLPAALVLENSERGGKAEKTPAASLLSQDLVIQGNVITEGDIDIEGTVEGDVSGSLLAIGETAVVRGELSANELVVHGRVVGRLRGLKVRLAATARVDGDVIARTLAIEAGAQFEGSVQRQENPLARSGGDPKVRLTNDEKRSASNASPAPTSSSTTPPGSKGASSTSASSPSGSSASPGSPAAE